MQVFLAILAVLAGALTWMFASAGLGRYRAVPGADWTEFAPGIAAGMVTVLLAGLGLFAGRAGRQRADIAARIAQSPDRPWLHVAGWDQGRIQEAPAKQAAVAAGASDLPGMPSKGAMRVTWLLSISASLPGVDYSPVFDVPVFTTEASDATSRIQPSVAAGALPR